MEGITRRNNYVLLAIILILNLVFIGCSGGSDGGGGDSWCPGTICTNCATDCPDLDCPTGQTQACVGGSYFDADPNLRCAFCQ